MRKILSTSVVSSSGMCPWKVGGLGAHTGLLLVRSNILSARVPVQLQLAGQGELSRIPPRPLENCWYKVPSGWDFCLLLGYVKQTASPYISMINCFTDQLNLHLAYL